MIVLALVVALIATGILYQTVGTHRDRKKFPAPGRLLRAAGVDLHLHERGTGSPVVVLESGIAASSLSWALVQPRIAEFAHVCSYDRAGLGWSGPCSMPRTTEQMSTELEKLLEAAQLRGPYILVGHSFGGLLIRAYAHRKPEQVQGLVFIDPVSIDYWANRGPDERRRLDLGASLSRRGAWLAKLGVVRGALAALASGGRLLPKLVARATATQQGTKLIENITGEIRRLPPELWPMIRANWSTAKCFEAMALYLAALPKTAREALGMPIPDEIPFIVLSASNATQGELEERESWVRRSRHAHHLRVPGSGHWIQLERPEAVVEAVREILRATREQ